MQVGRRAPGSGGNYPLHDVQTSACSSGLPDTATRPPVGEDIGEDIGVRIFHIVAPSAWAEATERGTYLPASYETDGFVHFSFADQVESVANAIYRDEPDLVVVEVDSEAVPAELRVEDCYEAGEQFPHVYGPIPTDAAVATHSLTRSSAGDWVFSPGGATAHA
jgi:uncharacterized protein (DUF952 family)